MLLTISSARLSSNRSINDLVDHRQMKSVEMKRQDSKQPKHSKPPKGSMKKANKGTKSLKGTGSVSAPSVFCSVLPALSASAPSGAKLFLYGVCDQLDAFAVPPFGLVSYGKCEIYTKSSRVEEFYIGTMRYQMDAGRSTKYNYFYYNQHFLKKETCHFSFSLCWIQLDSILQQYPIIYREQFYTSSNYLKHSHKFQSRFCLL